MGGAGWAAGSTSTGGGGNVPGARNGRLTPPHPSPIQPFPDPAPPTSGQMRAASTSSGMKATCPSTVSSAVSASAKSWSLRPSCRLKPGAGEQAGQGRRYWGRAARGAVRERCANWKRSAAGRPANAAEPSTHGRPSAGASRGGAGQHTAQGRSYTRTGDEHELREAQAGAQHGGPEEDLAQRGVLEPEVVQAHARQRGQRAHQPGAGRGREGDRGRAGGVVLGAKS